MRRRIAATRRLHGLRTGHASRATSTRDLEPGASARAAPAATRRASEADARALPAGPADRVGPHRADPDADAHSAPGPGVRVRPSRPHTVARPPARHDRGKRDPAAAAHDGSSGHTDRGAPSERVPGLGSPEGRAHPDRNHAHLAPGAEPDGSGCGPTVAILSGSPRDRGIRSATAADDERPGDTHQAGGSRNRASTAARTARNFPAGGEPDRERPSRCPRRADAAGCGHGSARRSSGGRSTPNFGGSEDGQWRRRSWLDCPARPRHDPGRERRTRRPRLRSEGRERLGRSCRHGPASRRGVENLERRSATRPRLRTENLERAERSRPRRAARPRVRAENIERAECSSRSRTARSRLHAEDLEWSRSAGDHHATRPRRRAENLEWTRTTGDQRATGPRRRAEDLGRTRTTGDQRATCPRLRAENLEWSRSSGPDHATRPRLRAEDVERTRDAGRRDAARPRLRAEDLGRTRTTRDQRATRP